MIISRSGVPISYCSHIIAFFYSPCSTRPLGPDHAQLHISIHSDEFLTPSQLGVNQNLDVTQSNISECLQGEGILELLVWPFPHRRGKPGEERVTIINETMQGMERRWKELGIP